MGLFDGMLGNASKIDAAKIQQEFAQVLAAYPVFHQPRKALIATFRVTVHVR